MPKQLKPINWISPELHFQKRNGTLNVEQNTHFNIQNEISDQNQNQRKGKKRTRLPKSSQRPSGFHSWLSLGALRSDSGHKTESPISQANAPWHHTLMFTKVNISLFFYWNSSTSFQQWEESQAQTHGVLLKQDSCVWVTPGSLQPPWNPALTELPYVCFDILNEAPVHSSHSAEVRNPSPATVRRTCLQWSWLDMVHMQKRQDRQDHPFVLHLLTNKQTN